MNFYSVICFFKTVIFKDYNKTYALCQRFYDKNIIFCHFFC